LANSARPATTHLSVERKIGAAWVSAALSVGFILKSKPLLAECRLQPLKFVAALWLTRLVVRLSGNIWRGLRRGFLKRTLRHSAISVPLNLKSNPLKRTLRHSATSAPLNLKIKPLKRTLRHSATSVFRLSRLAIRRVRLLAAPPLRWRVKLIS
jgi:hypothetical protein